MATFRIFSYIGLIGLLVIIVSALRLFSVILAVILVFPAILIIAEPGLFIAFRLVSLIAAAILAFLTLSVRLTVPTAISAIIAFSVPLLFVLLE